MSSPDAVVVSSAPSQRARKPTCRPRRSSITVTKCVIDEDVVRSKVNPTLVPVKETPKRQRQERTA